MPRTLGGAGLHLLGLARSRPTPLGLVLQPLLVVELVAVLVHDHGQHVLLAHARAEDLAELGTLDPEPVDAQADQVVIAPATQPVIVRAPAEQVLLELVDLGPEIRDRLGPVALGDVAELVHLLDPGQPQVAEVHVLDPQRVDLTVVPHERRGVVPSAGLGVLDQKLEADDVPIHGRLRLALEGSFDPGLGRLVLVFHVVPFVGG